MTLLEINQIFGSQGIFGKKALSIFEKYGTKAAITDFAILLGGYVSINTINDSNELKDRTGLYWTKTNHNNTDARAVNWSGIDGCGIVYERRGGCRPALPFSSISSIASNRVRGNYGVLRVEYGEYPQYVVDKNEQDILENLYNSNLLNPTGKVYTTDSRKYDEYDKDFVPNTLTEYEYNGRKFVKVIANSAFDGNEFKLSNGESYKDGDAVWVEVSPITWLVDEEKDIAVSERIIVAGIQFNKERNYKGDFDKTNMNSFMNTYLVNDIIPSKIDKLNTIEDNNNQELIKTIESIDSLEKEIKEKIEEIEKKKSELMSAKARLKELTEVIIQEDPKTKKFTI